MFVTSSYTCIKKNNDDTKGTFYLAFKGMFITNIDYRWYVTKKPPNTQPSMRRWALLELELTFPHPRMGRVKSNPTKHAREDFPVQKTGGSHLLRTVQIPPKLGVGDGNRYAVTVIASAPVFPPPIDSVLDLAVSGI